MYYYKLAALIAKFDYIDSIQQSLIVVSDCMRLIYLVIITIKLYTLIGKQIFIKKYSQHLFNILKIAHQYKCL